MNKQLQFELWQECNSRCKFCYLGRDNMFTPDELKVHACNESLKMISDLSHYPEYNTLAYLGGEFFQGQMSNPKVKEAFMELMEKNVELMDQGYVKYTWIYATLTLGDQKDLYDVLKLFEGHKGELWILTSYDTLGRFHTPKMEENWDYHMKHIHELYPSVKFNITTILSEDCIDKYLAGRLSFQKMSEKYHSEFFFKQCGCPEGKDKMIKNLPGFLPPRHKFLAFLRKFKEQESPLMWDKLFNIKYRADTLYRNGNDEEHQMMENIRNKNENQEISKACTYDELKIGPCGHLLSYYAYSDCEGCVLCDKQMIDELG